MSKKMGRGTKMLGILCLKCRSKIQEYYYGDVYIPRRTGILVNKANILKLLNLRLSVPQIALSLNVTSRRIYQVLASDEFNEKRKRNA